MKQKDKELLIRDLCARLPYGVKGILCEDCICTLDKIWTKKGYELVVFAGDYYDVECFKPYLFPLSSMTDGQKEELNKLTYGSVSVSKDYFYDLCNCSKISINEVINIVDWLNKNHFDYRRLIERGLAIDCTNLNIY